MEKSSTRISRFSALNLFTLAALFLASALGASATATLDTTFGNAGRAALPVFGESQNIVALTVQNNGKIIVVGNVFNGNTQQQDGVVARYNQNGTLDTSFGDGGKVVLQLIPRYINFYDVAVQSDGKIIAVGSIPPTENSANRDFLIVRFRENGSLDSSFGNNGIIIANQGSVDSFRAVKIQPDGKIVAVGGTSDSGGRGAVFRFNQDGNYDTSFGGGFILIDFPNGTNEIFTSLDFYANGRVLLGGDRIQGTGPGARGGFVTLLEPNGATIQNFGFNGFIQGMSLDTNGVQTKVKVLPNGKFVSGGDSLSIYTSNGVYESFTNVRNIAGLTLLSNDNLVTLSFTGISPESRGIRVYNKNFQLVGNDAKDFGIGEFDGRDIAVSLNDKIIILRNGEVIRLNGITSNATRQANYDDDNKTDVAVYRPANQTFYALRSRTGILLNYQSETVATRVIPERFYRADAFPYQFVYWQVDSTSNEPGYFKAFNGVTSFTFQWGASGDVPVGGDYDGDGFTDFTVFRPSNGTWYVSQSSNNQFRAFPFGQAGDKLVPADYDYDGITDFAVFRPSNGTWYISRSSDGGFRAAQFGASGDVPITGDFDGDGRADFTVFRPSNGVWYSLKTSEGFSAAAFGASSDQPVPGDYDGDGRHDIAVFRAGIWYINQSRDGFKAIQWGLPSDIPITVRY